MRKRLYNINVLGLVAGRISIFKRAALHAYVCKIVELFPVLAERCFQINNNFKNNPFWPTGLDVVYVLG